MIRVSTLMTFAEDMVTDLENIAQKLSTVQEILNGEAESPETDAETAADEAMEDSMEPDAVPPVYTETEDEDMDDPVPYENDEVPPEPVTDGEEETVPAPVDEEPAEEDDTEPVPEEENYSRKNKQVRRTTNFSYRAQPAPKSASTRYAKVKDFLSGAM